MIVVMPLKSASSDAALAPLFGNAKLFALRTEEGNELFLDTDARGGRDIARMLISNNVDILIVSHLGLNPYILLKSYGIKVYFAGDDRITFKEAIAKYDTGAFEEVTPQNYVRLLGEEHHSRAS